MSTKYIKEQILQGFIFPNNDVPQYDIDMVHDINNNSVSGDIDNVVLSGFTSTGGTVTFDYEWLQNGAEPWINDAGQQVLLSVHVIEPSQSYFKPWRTVHYVTTGVTGNTGYTGSTSFVLTPTALGLNSLSNGTYYFEFRMIGRRATYPICYNANITGITPSPTPTPTPTPTPCTCIDYTLNNTGMTGFLVSYQECPFGTSVINFVANAGESYNFCACQDSVGYEGGSPAQLINNGPCAITPTPTSTPTVTPTITPTVTPTVTPTITPTPTTGSCECYWFLNETGGMLNYTFDDCVAGSTMETLAGGASAYECVVVGSTIIADPGITVTQCEVNCTTTCLPCA